MLPVDYIVHHKHTVGYGYKKKTGEATMVKNLWRHNIDGSRLKIFSKAWLNVPYNYNRREHGTSTPLGFRMTFYLCGTSSIVSLCSGKNW